MRAVDSKSLLGAQATVVIAIPDNVPAGAVVIGYHVLSVDGHTIEDKLSFTIKSK